MRSGLFVFILPFNFLRRTLIQADISYIGMLCIELSRKGCSVFPDIILMSAYVVVGACLAYRHPSDGYSSSISFIGFLFIACIISRDTADLTSCLLQLICILKLSLRSRHNRPLSVSVGISVMQAAVGRQTAGSKSGSSLCVSIIAAPAAPRGSSRPLSLLHI